MVLRVVAVLDGNARRRCIGRKVNDADGRLAALWHGVRTRVGHWFRTRIRIGPRAGIGSVCSHAMTPEIVEVQRRVVSQASGALGAEEAGLGNS